MGEADDAFWPSHEPDHGDPNVTGWHYAALVCRRGHVIDHDATERRADVGYCSTCGAEVLSACPDCGLRLRGKTHYRMRVVEPFRPRAFCDGCGRALPWASRQQRTWELQNLLDQQGVDEADRVWIGEQLQRLQSESASLSEKQERDIWAGIKRRAPELFTGTGSAIIGGLVTAAIKPFLGLQ